MSTDPSAYKPGQRDPEVSPERTDRYTVERTCVGRTGSRPCGARFFRTPKSAARIPAGNMLDLCRVCFARFVEAGRAILAEDGAGPSTPTGGEEALDPEESDPDDLHLGHA